MKRRFAVIGDPIAHSKSPQMHRAAFAAMGLQHTYDAVLTSPAELAQRLDELRAGQWDGLNVTLPHKQAVLTLVDWVDPVAAAVGAANTLVRVGKALHAYNTDVPALGEELLELHGGVPGAGDCIVLGSGGAARAAVAACALYWKPARVIVRARAFDAQPALGTEFARAMQKATLVLGREVQVQAEGLHAGAEEGQCTCILQTTSAGMFGADSGLDVSRAVSWSLLPTEAVAFEAIYNPATTAFLECAKRRTLAARNGLGMLARQGALALERWLERPAPREAMLAALNA